MKLNRIAQILKDLPQGCVSTVPPVMPAEEEFLLENRLVSMSSAKLPPEVVSAGYDGFRQYCGALDANLKTVQDACAKASKELTAAINEYVALDKKQDFFHRLFTNRERLAQENSDIDGKKADYQTLDEKLKKLRSLEFTLGQEQRELRHSYLTPSGKLVNNFGVDILLVDAITKELPHSAVEYADMLEEGIGYVLAADKYGSDIAVSANNLVMAVINDTRNEGLGQISRDSCVGYVVHAAELLSQGKIPSIEFRPESKEDNQEDGWGWAEAELIITSS